MCLNCGFYNGRQVIDLAAKHKDRANRMQAKREAISAQAADTSVTTKTTALPEAK
jgi:hypothetical protein